MTAPRLTLCIVLLGGVLVPGSARAQAFWGVHGAWAQDSFDGTSGVGAELGLDIPVLPLDVFGAGTWFFPDCDDCDLKGWSLGVNYRVLPLPLLRPYVTGGVTWRDVEDPINGLVIEDSGAFVGVGLDLALAGFGVFAEGRYEFLDGDLGQAVLRAGVRIR